MTTPPAVVVGGVSFPFLCNLLVERDRDGRPLEFRPQGRYAKASTTPLNPNGGGPFCRLVAPGAQPVPGVYVLAVDDRPMYVGRASNLRERFGSRGYGTIQPKNCYVGGQSTNCKVNHRVLREAKAGRTVALHFIETTDFEAVESGVLGKSAPPWNGR